MAIEHKPSKNEDEYFAKYDAELIKSQREKLDEERRRAEKKAHWMKCPKCGTDLREKSFHHVKVDICDSCGGTWLDKGELAMLTHVERNSVSRFIGGMLGLGDDK